MFSEITLPWGRVIANVNTFLNTITLHCCPTLEQGRVPYPEGRVPQCKNGVSVVNSSMLNVVILQHGSLTLWKMLVNTGFAKNAGHVKNRKNVVIAKNRSRLIILSFLALPVQDSTILVVLKSPLVISVVWILGLATHVL